MPISSPDPPRSFPSSSPPFRASRLQNCSPEPRNTATGNLRLRRGESFPACDTHPRFFPYSLRTPETTSLFVLCSEGATSPKHAGVHHGDLDAPSLQNRPADAVGKNRLPTQIRAAACSLRAPGPPGRPSDETRHRSTPFSGDLVSKTKQHIYSAKRY